MMQNTPERDWKMRECLALAVEGFERDESERIADELRCGSPFTFGNVAKRLDVPLLTLVRAFMTEVYIGTGEQIVPLERAQ